MVCVVMYNLVIDAIGIKDTALFKCVHVYYENCIFSEWQSGLRLHLTYIRLGKFFMNTFLSAVECRSSEIIIEYYRHVLVSLVFCLFVSTIFNEGAYLT